MQKGTNLGWIGLGVMGEPMCRHLMVAGFPMSVFTRSKEKAGGVLGNGAKWCETPAEVASQCDVVFTMVGSKSEIDEVYFSGKGLFSAVQKNQIFIDMGTTSPALTAEMSSAAKEKGAQLIDAPVSGGDVGAVNASLSIMAGGDAGTIDSVSDLFACMGKVQVMGESGSGQHTKMCNQIVVAGTMIGVCESLLYARRAGLDCTSMISAIRPGAAGCWTLDNLAPRIIEKNFSSGFMVNHFIKDLSIAVNECITMNLNLPGLVLAKQLYEKVHKMGHGRSATQALLLALDDGIETK